MTFGDEKMRIDQTKPTTEDENSNSLKFVQFKVWAQVGRI